MDRRHHVRRDGGFDELTVFFFQAEDGIRDWSVTGVQTCALPILAIGDARIAIEEGVDRGTRGSAGSPETASSIAIRASPIACSRCFGSFVRQRRASSRMHGGGSAGRAAQSGSVFQIAASGSEEGSPRNPFPPASSP